MRAGLVVAVGVGNVIGGIAGGGCRGDDGCGRTSGASGRGLPVGFAAVFLEFGCRVEAKRAAGTCARVGA